MDPFKNHRGFVVPLDIVSIETEQILPIRFLKRSGRTGFASGLFYDLRFNEEGSAIPDFALNKRKYADTTILLARNHFGCGLSNEQAVWALKEYGFQVILAASFSDIFYMNCLKNGLLPVVLCKQGIAELFAMAKGSTLLRLTVDLQKKIIRTDDGGFERAFEIDEFYRQSLLEGTDSIVKILQREDSICAYEEKIQRISGVHTFLTK